MNEQAYAQEQRRLTRPLGSRMIAGVCAGIAQYFGWDVSLVRVVAVLAILFGVGTPVLAYLIAYLIIPDSPMVVPMQPSTGTGAGAGPWQDVPRP